jgi:hypothetical protein
VGAVELTVEHDWVAMWYAPPNLAIKKVLLHIYTAGGQAFSLFSCPSAICSASSEQTFGRGGWFSWWGCEGRL